MNFDELTEAIAEVIREHQLTHGVAVAMGSTCRCGYWNGREEPGKTRPVGYQGLQWHQAEEVRKRLAEVPDLTHYDRGFGNCPHCRSPLVTRCHECGREIDRDQAPAAGWRMDHLSGYGCISYCLDCKGES